MVAAGRLKTSVKTKMINFSFIEINKIDRNAAIGPAVTVAARVAKNPGVQGFRRAEVACR